MEKDRIQDSALAEVMAYAESGPRNEIANGVTGFQLLRKAELLAGKAKYDYLLREYYLKSLPKSDYPEPPRSLLPDTQSAPNLLPGFWRD